MLRFRFSSSRLERLYTEERGAQRYPPEVVEAFVDVIATIDSAVDERDLRALKHLHFEKLKGKRRHQRSLRLHGGFRLVVQLVKEDEDVLVLVEEIEDYHCG